MERYIHNECEVTLQFASPDEFLKLLNNNGIIPVELPTLDQLVYKYTRQGEKKYAVVIDEADCELIYITSQVPEDGWSALVYDVDNQRKGKKPAVMKNRAQLAMREASLKAYETADKLCGEVNDVFEIMSDEEKRSYDKWEKEYLFWYREYLKNYGYWDRDSFGKVDMTGVNTEMLDIIYGDN